MNNKDEILAQAQKIAGVEITDRAKAVLDDPQKIAMLLSKLDSNDVAMLSNLVSGKAASVDTKALERIKKLLEE